MQMSETMDINSAHQTINQLRQQLQSINSTPVQLQVKQINLIQKQLRLLKKEINLVIREINQNATQATPDSIMSVGLDILGKRKLAGQLRQSTRRAIQAEKVALRQPYLDLKADIDSALLLGDQLKLQIEQMNY
ncbi:MAG: hypothetical protein IGQ45_03090 [Cyanobacterium sp. T60_A2020_053]|nr:hypothetical protein [Cyanobacterium sp. T60_A2020_053]